MPRCPRPPPRRHASPATAATRRKLRFRRDGRAYTHDSTEAARGDDGVSRFAKSEKRAVCCRPPASRRLLLRAPSPLQGQGRMHCTCVRRRELLTAHTKCACAPRRCARQASRATAAPAGRRAACAAARVRSHCTAVRARTHARAARTHRPCVAVPLPTITQVSVTARLTYQALR